MIRKRPKIKRTVRVLLIFFVFRVAVCGQADLVILNADIRTIDRKQPRAAALAVTKNRISAVGANREIRASIGENTVVVDAGGKLLLPGFNDAHVHFMGMGNQFFSVDLRGARSPREMAEKLRFHARFVPPGLWILGGGWNSDNWTPNALPTKDSIDAAAPDNPVFLYHANGEIALVNSSALKRARIDKTDDASNGGIVRDADGAPTGILRDAAMRRVRGLAPRFATEDKAAVAETASRYAAAFGVTSVQDMSADDFSGIYRALEKAGKLKTRIYDCAELPGWQKRAKTDLKPAAESLVRGGCLKGFTDGDADSIGALFEEISAADRAGRQVMIHAIGARSNEQVLSIFERVVKANGARDRRFRVEHAHGFRPPDAARFAGSGIVASVQPFLFSDEAGRSFDALRNLSDRKAPLAFGSDASMIPIDPLFGIAAAVDANDARQKLTVEEAVRAYTLGSAHAEFQESEKGSITVGKLADFVILSDDIFTIPASKIRGAKILTTVMNGEIVYRAD